MIAGARATPSPDVRAAAAAAWTFRERVELEAEARFERLARRMERLGAPVELARMARRASADERRHAALCAERATRLGASGARAAAPAEVAEIAPASRPLRERVLYEVVAACCVSETESMGVLTALLGAAREPALRRTLRELARDEVRHARLGWAYLAHAGRAGDVAFLGALLPAMLDGSIAPDLFDAAPAEREDVALLDLGVLPHRRQREAFERTLEEVILPGLEHLGVDAGAARAWLAEKRQHAHPTGGDP